MSNFTMQIPSSATKAFDRKSLEEFLKQENKFITDLLNILPFPTRISNNDDALLQTKSTTKKPISKKQTSRAQSLVELQERIKQMTSKKGLTYKEKLLKKNLKSKLKKKNKSFHIQHSPETKTQPKIKTEEHDLHLKANENIQADRMQFSKIDFSNIEKYKKNEKQDPHKLLLDIRKVKSKLDKLRESGEVEQANKFKEKQAWKNALARAQGEKIKDDEQLLTKSIKRTVQKHKQSRKKWESRIEAVRKAQEDKQTKRQENIHKRKKTKMTNKLKKAAKKGKIIPGF